MEEQNTRFESKFTILILLMVILFQVISCDKRKPNYTDVIGESYNSTTIKAADLPNGLNAFIFMSPECPLSENYSRTIINLSNEFSQKNVGIYIVFPGEFYQREEIEVFIEKYNLSNELLIYDPNYLFKKYFSATITPEVFLCDVTGTILYSGAIDNWAITLGKQRQVITEHYLKDAIKSALNNNDIKTKATRAVGCIIE